MLAPNSRHSFFTFLFLSIAFPSLLQKKVDISHYFNYYLFIIVLWYKKEIRKMTDDKKHYFLTYCRGSCLSSANRNGIPAKRLCSTGYHYNSMLVTAILYNGKAINPTKVLSLSLLFYSLLKRLSFISLRLPPNFQDSELQVATSTIHCKD